MSLIRRLLSFIMFVALIPAGMEAQEQKGDIDFNIAISTTGLFALADWDYTLTPYEMSYYNLSVYNLGDLETDSYNSTLYPCVSAELAYKLADSGFFKRLSLVGYAGFHWADYQPINIVSDAKDGKETAKKLDWMLGFRYSIINSRYFHMYTQAFLGGEIKNDCAYWDITGDAVYGGWLGKNDIRWQITYLGFKVKLGRSNLGVMTELGFGSEYCLSYIPVFPGIRAGLSYKF